MKILVSACLLNVPCRYDGKGAPNTVVFALAKEHTLIPICPEQLGGLPAPRQPAEIRGDQVMTKSGENLTEPFMRGAKCALDLAGLLGCTHAVLKQNSPSCGCGRIYDGTFAGRKIDGDGLMTALLKKNGIIAYSDDAIEELA